MHGCANFWLETQYTQLLMQLPLKARPTEAQINEGVKVMRSVFAPYTIAEILLFFGKVRTGDYICYNRGNVQELLELFNSRFLPYRSDMMDEASHERAKRESRERDAEKAAIWNKAVQLGLTKIEAPADKEEIRQWLDGIDGIMRETLEYLYNVKFKENGERETEA